MGKPIGGYPELELFSGAEYWPLASAWNITRSALKSLVTARGIRRLWLPSFLCGCVAESLRRDGECSLVFYEVDGHFAPLLPDTWPTEDALYLVNYYGQLTGSEIAHWTACWGGRVIVDNVQAFFQPPVPGTDTLYCCRKWFGVPDGAYLITDLDLPIPQPAAVREWMAPLLGRFEDGPEAWFSCHSAREAAFDDAPVAGMSELSHNLLRAVNYPAVQARRNANFTALHAALSEANALALHVPQGAFYYPFCCQRAPEIRAALIKQRIFVPVLWPDTADPRARTILPLPVDQRYDEADMQRVSDTLLDLL